MIYRILIKHPTMAPFCKDEEKYQVVEELVNQVEEIKNNKT
jgi:phosphomannomutase/phosphoglucomutase